MGYSRIADIIYDLNLEDANSIIRQSYYDQGYNGEFGTTARLYYHNSKINLFAPEYTKFMLFGRGPGKMPPTEPIESWMERYGITGSSWAIRRKIAEQGTAGNNFISPALPSIVQSVKLKIVNEVTKVMVGELVNMMRR